MKTDCKVHFLIKLLALGLERMKNFALILAYKVWDKHDLQDNHQDTGNYFTVILPVRIKRIEAYERISVEFG